MAAEDALLRAQRLSTAVDMVGSQVSHRVASQYASLHREASMWRYLLLGIVAWAVMRVMAMVSSAKREHAAILRFAKSQHHTRAPDWGLALSIEYPVFARIWYANRSFPAALRLAYMSRGSHAKVTQPGGITKLLEASQQQPEYGPRAIVCHAFHRQMGSERLAECMPFCEHVPAFDRLAAGIDGFMVAGETGGILYETIPGSQVNSTATSRGKAVAGLGFALGAGLGAWKAVSDEESTKELCRQVSNTNCVGFPEACKQYIEGR
jgi:hypothetical protein